LLAAVQFASNHRHEFPFAELVAKWHSLADINAALQSTRDKTKIRVGIRP